MGATLDKLPSWSETALQGLAFWMGHRQSLYRHYPLGEAALVAEACNLIFANLSHGETLLCERQYSQLLPDGKWPDDLGPRSRADLVVVRSSSNSQSEEQQSLAQYVTTVIEVKRESAPTAQINQDLQRLSTLKLALPQVRAFLFVVSEAKRPRRFVASNGASIRGKHRIANGNTHFRVRRSCKAAAAFSRKDTAHYACVIEVFVDGAM